MKVLNRLYVAVSLIALVALGIGYYGEYSRAAEAEALNARVASLIIRPGSVQMADLPVQVQRGIQSQSSRAGASATITIRTPQQYCQQVQSSDQTPPKILKQILDEEQAVIDDFNRRHPGVYARLGLRVTDRLEEESARYMKNASNSSY